MSAYAQCACINSLQMGIIKNIFSIRVKIEENAGGMSRQAGKKHVTSLGKASRRIRNITANVGNRYEFKIAGGSPKIRRGLDSHGFADLKAAVMTYASNTSVYPDKDEPRHFDLGTPAEVFRSIERAWAVAPTSKKCPNTKIARKKCFKGQSEAGNTNIDSKDPKGPKHARHQRFNGAKEIWSH